MMWMIFVAWAVVGSRVEPVKADRTDEPVELPREIFLLKEDARPEVALSLADCVALTVADNLEILQSRLNQAIAGKDIHRSLDAFIPTLRSGLNYTSNWLNGFSTKAEPTSRDFTLGGFAQLAGALPIGTTITTTLSLNDRQSLLAADPYRYTGTASFRFEVTQSLLQRLGFTASAAEFLTARASKRAADQRLQAAFEAIVQRVAATYYSLYEAREVLKVRREGRRLALELYDVTKKRIATGAAAPYEIYQAQSTLAARYSLELSAEQAQINAEESLLQLFNARVRSDGKISPDAFVVIPSAPTPLYDGVATDQLFDKALKQRPDFLAIGEDQRGAEVQEYAALRKLFPELQIGAFFEGSPQAGRLGKAQAQLVDSGALATDRRQLGNLETAFGNLGDGTFYNYGMYVTLEVPLFFGTARYNHRVASAAVERVKLGRFVQEQRVRTEVTLALAQQQFAAKRMQMAKMQLNAAQQNLLAETKKQKLGTSSNFDVLRIQDEVTNALFNLALSTADLGRAVANVRFALGEGRTGMNFEVNSGQK